MLTVRSNGRGDLKLSLSKEDIQLGLGGEREKAGPPWRRQGLGTHQSFENKAKAMG